MSRIEINDLPVEMELNRKEQQDVAGGWSFGESQTDLITAAGPGGGPHIRQSAVDPLDPSAGQKGIIAVLIGL